VKELNALFSLLDDESKTVQAELLLKFQKYGLETRDKLLDHYHRSSNKIVQKNIIAILESLQKSYIKSLKKEFFKESNLLDFFNMISLLFNPLTNFQTLSYFLHKAEDRLTKNREKGTPTIDLLLIGDYFFKTYGFRAMQYDHQDENYILLDSAVFNRKAEPISLCLLYYLLAKRFGIELNFIILRDYIMVKYKEGSEERYIDVLGNGNLLTVNETETLLRTNYISFDKSSFIEKDINAALTYYLERLTTISENHENEQIIQALNTVKLDFFH
jgi:regulator of sirC expression with transglutaminase-like and TPR domain